MAISWKDRNSLIEHTRSDKMRHCMVKKFKPIDTVELKRYGWYGGDFKPTSIPKKMWAVSRARAKKRGQLCLILN